MTTSIKTETLQDKIIKLYFGGSIHPGDRADYFIQFLKAYAQLRLHSPHLWEQFRIVINGNYPTYFDKELKKINDPNIIYEKGALSWKQYIQKFNDPCYGILPVNDDFADCLFLTKGYDYLYLEKPIIHLGKKGKVSDFIEQNGIGFNFDPNEKTEVFFQKLLEDSLKLQYPKEVHDKIEKEYDIKNLCLKYLDLINQK